MGYYEGNFQKHLEIREKYSEKKKFFSFSPAGKTRQTNCTEKYLLFIFFASSKRKQKKKYPLPTHYDVKTITSGEALQTEKEMLLPRERTIGHLV